jgi:hypothetical protein
MGRDKGPHYVSFSILLRQSFTFIYSAQHAVLGYTHMHSCLTAKEDVKKRILTQLLNIALLMRSVPVVIKMGRNASTSLAG